VGALADLTVQPGRRAFAVTDTCLRAASIIAPMSRTSVDTSASTWAPDTRAAFSAAAPGNCRSDAAPLLELLASGLWGEPDERPA